MKRSGPDVLFCCEDSEPVALRLAGMLRDSGMFEGVTPIDAATFEAAASKAVSGGLTSGCIDGTSIARSTLGQTFEGNPSPDRN